MSTDTLKDLLHEVADAVEPGDRLDAIRAATTASGRRTRPGWWAAGGVGLVAASVVTALALSTGGTPQSEELGPAAPAPTTAATTATEDPVPTRYGPIEVYFVGDTARGQRLYHELRQVPDDPFSVAVAALAAPPTDPDYVSLWPTDAIVDASFDGVGEEGLIGVEIDPSYATRPASMTPEQAGLAVEQVVRTMQATLRTPAPVQFHADGNPINQVLGVPTSEPLAARPDADVLPGVSLSEPSEGHEMREGKGLTIDGVGLVEGNEVAVRVRREGGPVVIAATFDLEPADTTLPYFSTSWFNDDLTPATYLVSVSVTNADGTVDTDTRSITVVAG